MLCSYIPTLQPSQVIAPKWNPDDGALHTLHEIDLKSTLSFLSSSQPEVHYWNISTCTTRHIARQIYTDHTQTDHTQTPPNTLVVVVVVVVVEHYWNISTCTGHITRHIYTDHTHRHTDSTAHSTLDWLKSTFSFLSSSQPEHHRNISTCTRHITRHIYTDHTQRHTDPAQHFSTSSSRLEEYWYWAWLKQKSLCTYTWDWLEVHFELLIISTMQT